MLTGASFANQTLCPKTSSRQRSGLLALAVVPMAAWFREVSYRYRDFDTDPHPALLRSVKLSLRTREIDCLEYAANANPPILHRKERFLMPNHSIRAKFAELTQQEEKHRLLEDPATIGTREGWQARLRAAGFALRGHRLVRR